MKPDIPLDIILLLRLSYGSGRDILHGFSTWVRRERRHWRLHVVNFEIGRAAEDIQSVMRDGADGIVTHGLSRPVMEAIRDFKGPIVMVGRRETSKKLEEGHPRRLAFVSADEVAVARRGAAYLESLGRMRSYGYIGRASRTKRCQEFSAALSAHNREPRLFFSEFIGGRTPEGEPADEALGRWLADLPKPAAVMAETDNYAVWVLERAASVGVNVPKDLAVLGVDNDELLCDMAEPPLSSIAVDHERLGELAGEAMGRLLAASGGRRPKAARRRAADAAEPFTLMAPVIGVVERQSARPVAPAVALAERAHAFILRNAVRGIAAADVAAHLGVSRTLADLRFRQVYGESILATILQLRLEAVKRKLSETALPIGRICASCGFRSDSRAKHLFKERFGVSMRQWRAGVR